MSVHNLPMFMGGDIQDMIDALQMAENAERLKEGTAAFLEKRKAVFTGK